MNTVRIWLSALIIGAAASLGMMAYVAPAKAQECALPLAGILAAGEAQGISDKIEVIRDIGFINDYTKAMGLPIPDGSEPVGIIFVYGTLATGQEAVRVGLIEPGDCIVHHILLPAARHAIAYGRARTGV